MTTMKSTCAVCPKPIWPGHLMCAAHWQRVPKAHSDAVLRIWGAFMRSKSTEQRLVLRSAYEKARDAAIAAVQAAND